MKACTVKLLFLTILAGLVSSLFLPQFFQKTSAVNQQVTGIVDYEDLTDAEDIIEKYHESLNEYLNDTMDILLSTENENTIKEQEALPAPGPDGKRDFRTCPGKYTSTWCVSMVMTDEYYRLREKLLEKRRGLVTNLKDAQKKAQEKLAERRKKDPQASKKDIAPQYQDYVSAVQEIDATIEKELSMAQKTLELSVAAYDELHFAWAMHKKYLILIDQLEDYRNALASIRDEVELFPVTFFNVQTSQCT